MESMLPQGATLVDLLDRILDRGLVLNADIVIYLAGVPLIGINLRAALAGMETMTRHGLMKEWDQNIRSQMSDDYGFSRVTASDRPAEPVQPVSMTKEF